jgi:thioredoxin 1
MADRIEKEYRMGKPVVVTDASFQQEVLESPVPVLVDFWAEWCSPCRMIAPHVEEIAKQLDGQLKVGKLDVDSNQDTAMQYGVMGIPTLILYKNGRPIERITGYMPKERLLQRISPHLNGGN